MQEYLMRIFTHFNRLRSSLLVMAFWQGYQVLVLTLILIITVLIAIRVYYLA